MIGIPNQLVGAMEGEEIILECHSEAYPKSINYWTRENGNIISQGKKIYKRENCMISIKSVLFLLTTVLFVIVI